MISSFVMTLNRNIGMGSMNTMARIGAIIGPQLVYLVYIFLFSLWSFYYPAFNIKQHARIFVILF
jgi:hypothetical protein